MSLGVLVGILILICWWCGRQLPKDSELSFYSLNPFKGGELHWEVFFYWGIIIGLVLIGLNYLGSGGGGYEEWELPSRY
jgi:hypothetical protein